MGAIGAVILAAGGSTRLGQPKQLVRHAGETLVRRTARAAIEAGCENVVVVVGEERAAIAEALADLEVQICPHALWPRGIGSSIRAGLAAALAHQPALDAVLIAVCDQPFVSAALFSALIEARAKERTPAAACVYAGTIGVPALFDCTLFPALAALADEQGAKAILSTLSDRIARLDFADGAIDIDTPADLHRLALKT